MKTVRKVHKTQDGENLWLGTRVRNHGTQIMQNILYPLYVVVRHVDTTKQKSKELKGGRIIM